MEMGDGECHLRRKGAERKRLQQQAQTHMTAVWLLSCEWRKRSLDIDAIRTIPQTRGCALVCVFNKFSDLCLLYFHLRG